MNKRVLKLSMVGVLALLLTLPTIAYTQRGGPGGPGAPGWAAPENGPARGGQQRGSGRRGAGAGFARGVGRGGMVGGGRGSIGGRPHLAARALRAADTIGLTAEQTELVNDAQRAHREAAINRRAASQIAELELGDLSEAEVPDIAAVEAKLRELSEHQIATRTGGLRLDASVREILTAEQIDELDDIGDGRDRRGPVGPRGRGGRGGRRGA